MFCMLCQTEQMAVVLLFLKVSKHSWHILCIETFTNQQFTELLIPKKKKSKHIQLPIEPSVTRLWAWLWLGIWIWLSQMPRGSISAETKVKESWQGLSTCSSNFSLLGYTITASLHPPKQSFTTEKKTEKCHIRMGHNTSNFNVRSFLYSHIQLHATGT